jgi:hypothetical protein
MWPAETVYVPEKIWWLPSVCVALMDTQTVSATTVVMVTATRAVSA